MYRVLIVFLVLDALVLAVAILLQAGKGGGLAASFGGAGSSPNSLLGSREAGNLLTKTSWWAGGLFLGIAFTLHLMAAGGGPASSVLDTSFQQGGAPTAPPTGQSAVPLQPIPPAAGGDTGGAAPPAGKQQ